MTKSVTKPGQQLHSVYFTCYYRVYHTEHDYEMLRDDYSGLHPLSCSGSVQSVHSITVTMNALYEDSVIYTYLTV